MMRATVWLAVCLWALQAQAVQARDIAAEDYGEPGSDAADWGYEGATGPEHWGKLSPAFRLCAEGLQQSPVDITDSQPRRLPHLVFQYRSNALHMVNDGLAIRLLYEPGSYMRVGSHRYELEHVDFHTPGEHTKNGFAPDMEIHLVHRDAAGNYALVAIPVIAGRRHQLIQQTFGITQAASPLAGDHLQRLGFDGQVFLPGHPFQAGPDFG